MGSEPQRLLFVHPDSTQRDAFAVAFGYAFQVQTAASGAAASRLASRESFALVVVDDGIRDTDPWTLVHMIAPTRPQTAFVIVVDGSRPVRQSMRPVAATVAHPWTAEQMHGWLARALEKQRRWASPESQASRKRILLVSPDDTDGSEGVRGKLNRLGWSVRSVGDLPEARRALDEDQFRVVLTSVSLPSAEGDGVVRALTEAAPDTPVIVWTQHGDPALESACVRAGAQDCIVDGSHDLVLLGRTLRHAIERHAATRRDAPQPRIDPATGLMNRQAFIDVVQRTMSRCRRTDARFAVVHLDIDRFRAVRDRLGRIGSDALLQRIGDRLLDGLRVYDTVARIGPDAFGIVLDELKAPGEEETIVERLLDGLSAPFSVEERRVHVSASAGIAVFPDATDRVAQLLEKAECAMYEAKSNLGRSLHVYVPEARLQYLREVRELEDALEMGLLGFHYQPQYALDGGELVGFEALLRLTAPDGTVRTPGAFLPLLEESGLIHEVGARSIAWALDRIAACRARPNRAAVRVAINLSACQFENPDLIRRIGAALDAYRLPADALELEISEGLLMQDTDHSRATLRALKDLGVRIAIDNFGTGLSSLAYLQRFQVDALKLDRSFVAMLDPHDGHGDETIAAAIIGLGAQLGLDVVAEGIETEVQRERLAELGAVAGQGWLLGRPAPMEAFIDVADGLSVRLTG
jgi:diguanylate cyclase (GGDEF)-like protein